MQEQLFEVNEDKKRLNIEINQLTIRINEYSSSQNS